MSFESGKNNPTRIAHRIESEKPETSSEVLQKLLKEHGDSVFIKRLSSADVHDLDIAFNNRRAIPFSALAYYEGDEKEMLSALKALTYAVGDVRKEAVQKVVDLVESDTP